MNPRDHASASGAAAERGVAPVEALELKMLDDDLSFINVRFAGERCCYVDPGERGRLGSEAVHGLARAHRR